MQTKLKIIIKRMPADESNVEFSGFIKMYFSWLIIHFSPNDTPQITHAKVIAVSASDQTSILDMYRDLCDFCCQDEFEHSYAMFCGFIISHIECVHIVAYGHLLPASVRSCASIMCLRLKICKRQQLHASFFLLKLFLI